MIDHLYSQFHKHPNVGIACLYADYKDQTNQTLAHILGSFLRQILTTAPEPVPDEIIHKLHDIRSRGGKVGTEDNLAMLKIQLQQLNRAFICIDAVDELEPKVRRQLFSKLKELGTNTRLFLTGRGHIESEVARHFQVMQGYAVLVSASQQDIQEFVIQQIKEDHDSDTMNEVLAKDIVDAIFQKSQGM